MHPQAWPESLDVAGKNVVVIDTGSGERRILLSAPGFDFTAPRISPDGKRVVAIRERHESYDQASALTVVMVCHHTRSALDRLSDSSPTLNCSAASRA